jgi:hypothetical protein
VRDEWGLSVLRETEIEGWRLWHLHHSTRGYWEARLYRIARVDAGRGEEWLSPHGQGATPEDAVRACLRRLVEDVLHGVRHEPVLRLEAALARLTAYLETRL